MLLGTWTTAGLVLSALTAMPVFDGPTQEQAGKWVEPGNRFNRMLLVDPAVWQEDSRLPLIRRHMQLQPDRLRQGLNLDPNKLSSELLALVEPPVLGLTLQSAPDVLRAQLDLPEGVGLVVTDVADDSPAAKAGLKKNDILLAADGAELKTVEDLQAALDKTKNDLLSLSILRKGEKQEVKLPALKPESELDTRQFFIGLQVGELDEATRDQLNLGEDQGGLVVLSVVPDSPADKAKLQKNDIVVKFGDDDVRSAPDLIAKVQELGENEATLTIIRDGEQMTVQITPVKRSEDQAANRFFQPGGQPGQFRFFGPGVIVQPDGTLQGKPGAQPRTFNFRLNPGQNPADWLMLAPDENLRKQLEDLNKKLEQLQKQLDAMKKEIAGKNDKKKPD